MKTKRHYLLVATAVAALSVAIFLSNSRNRYNQRQLAAAENEVYEAVVNDMIGPAKGPGRLMFDDTTLTELAPGADMKSCKETARKNLRLEESAPPYNSLADKLYRLVNYGYYDHALKADTIQDFLTKSCTPASRLPQTFHTHLPKTFIAGRNVHFSGLDSPANYGEDSISFELFPGAAGVISFSHVGFDSTLREAIVSSSFFCGTLCGSGHRYALRKVRGHWRVVNEVTTWVS